MKRIMLVMTMAGSLACGNGQPSGTNTPVPTTAPAAGRQYLLERVDDAAIVQLYADGFAALPLKEKTLIWHLYQAAIAGRDILLRPDDTRTASRCATCSKRSSRIRRRRPETLEEIQRYTKLFWINSGPYNNLTARKFVLQCTPEALAAAAHAAASAGATVPARSRRDARSAAGAAAADVLRSRTSIRTSPARRRRRARTSSPRARTTSTSA